MKKQIFGRVGSILLSVCMLMAAMPLCAAAEGGNIYYVATDGSDANDGSLSAPFKTLNHAASVLKAGDTCYIRGGVYYEEFNAALSGTEESPITICAYKGEPVTISAGQPLTDWEPYNDNIYVTDMDWDIYEGNGNMIFCDNVQGIEARWPNAKADELLELTSYARIDSASGMTITDSDLPNIDLTGAELWCASGAAYWSYLTQITSCNTSAHSVTLQNVFPYSDYYPRAGNIYYITRSMALLDSPGEWYKDVAAGKLYIYMADGDSPENHQIEARKRTYTVHLENASYVTFDGIDIHGGLAAFDGNTHHCTFHNALIEGLDYNMERGGVTKEVNGTTTTTNGQGAAQGFVLGGSHNTLSNCEIKNTYGEGVTIQGSYNKAVNNYVHDINFENTYSDGIYITGQNHLICRNTITRTGRGSIGGRYDSCVISYNDVSDSGRISRDGGSFYFNAHDYQNSEIHHNVIHDTLDNEGLQYALYLDSFSTSLIIYNNVVYHAEKDDETSSASGRLSLCLNPNSLGNVIANNTFVNSRNTPMAYSKHDMSGTVVVNNLFRSRMFDKTDEELTDMGMIVKNNLSGWLDFNTGAATFKDFWADSANGDFTLSAASEAVDAGVYIPGITENYIGSAPDCGAYEYGKEPWTAGHDFSKNYHVEFSLNEAIPYRNLVTNRGFEADSKVLENWETEGNPQVFHLESWSYFGRLTRDGGYSALLSDGDSITQTITGLKPLTTYKVSGYAALGGDYKRCYSYAQAYDKSLNEMARITATEPLTNIGGIGALRYDGVNFGSGSDRLLVGFRYPKAGQTLKVCLDGLDNVVATVAMDAVGALVDWKWFSVDLGQSYTGQHSVYLCLEGDFSNTTYGGFYTYSTTADEAVTISATADNGETNRVDIKTSEFDMPAPSFTVTTGAAGTVTVTVSKRGTTMKGYVDYINVAEQLDSLESGTKGVFKKAVAVWDASGQPQSNVTAGELNLFEVALHNNTDAALSFNGILAMYDKDGRVVEIMHMPYSVKAGGTGKYIMGLKVPEGVSRVAVYSWDEGLAPVTTVSSFEVKTVSAAAELAAEN